MKTKAQTFEREPTARELMAKLDAICERLDHLVPPAEPRAWLSIEEAADLCGRSMQSVRAWCREQRIGTRIKNRWQVDRTALRRLLVEKFGEATLPQGLRCRLTTRE